MVDQDEGVGVLRFSVEANRFRILHVPSRRDSRSCEPIAELGSPQPSVSYHLTGPDGNRFRESLGRVLAGVVELGMV
jgi:hypothetical protein